MVEDTANMVKLSIKVVAPAHSKIGAPYTPINKPSALIPNPINPKLSRIVFIF